MRTAIVHYWLLNRRGGEKVLDALCRLLPEADIFTLFCDPETLSSQLRGRNITTSFLNPARRYYRSLLPVMPLALESFDLRGYDLVVSSEAGPAKGVITSSTTHHICYCHTPMRYLWDLYPAYRNEYTKPGLKRILMAPLTNYLRLWDFASAARVDRFIANSVNVQRRIWKTYRRESEVIHPPVDVDSFYQASPEDYFLIVSELVPYKRIYDAVRLFSRTGRRLMVAGGGPELGRLRREAGPSVQLLGRVSDADLRNLYAHCRAFLMPGEEDFGITAVEALASGKPVIALARGGATEALPSFGAVLYPDDLEDALKRFDLVEPDIRASDLQAWARRFSEDEFSRKMLHVLREWAVAGATPVVAEK